MADNNNWFLFGNTVEETSRFTIFSISHFIYITVGCLLIAGLIWYIRKCEEDQADLLIKISSAVLFICYFLRAYMFYRYYESFKLLDIAPLHLCIISGFILPAAAFTGNRLLWNLSYGILMPGAVIAIITPELTLTGYHAFSWMPLIFFIWHFLVVLIPILQVASGRLIPDIGLYPKVISLLGFYALFIFILNKQLGTNFLYLNRAARGTPLEWFERWLGNPGYIVPMALSVLLVSFLLFLPWIRKLPKPLNFTMM